MNSHIVLRINQVKTIMLVQHERGRFFFSCDSSSPFKWEREQHQHQVCEESNVYDRKDHLKNAGISVPTSLLK